jgi:ATP-dependent DNA helicase PIF1
VGAGPHVIENIAPPHLQDALQEELDNASRRPAALKENATAILTYNMDTSQGLYNGSVGVVEKLHGDSATVRFRNGSVVVQCITTERELGDGSVVTLEFLPLRAAYSCTIDKSQGITLDAADVHLTANMKDGAAYTALSRVRSLDSLIIRTDPGWSPDALFESAFRTSEAVLDFLKKVGV